MSPRLRELGLLAALVTSCAGVRHDPPRPGQLRASWRAYGHDYVQGDGRVVDQTRGGISTSEGQAYGMLRSVWIDDRRSFERMRTWTLANLQGADPHALPAWKWGAREDGSWGVIDPQPASDADVLLAYALLAGAERWRKPALEVQARGLIAAIWAQEVGLVGGQRVLLPGPWAKGQDPVLLNPSYWAVFTYRAFDALGEQPWHELVDPAYAWLAAGFDRYGLPPDWMYVDATSGALVDTPVGSTHLPHFGFEALRLPWLMLADARWHQDVHAKALVARFEVLGERFQAEGRLPAVQGPEGEAMVDYETRSLYGALLPLWADTRPADVPALLARIEALELPAPRSREQGRDYYAENWVWFGKALWARMAPPLTPVSPEVR